MFKLARRRYLQEIFDASSSCTGDCGQGRRCTCDPDREESAGKPTNGEAQLPNGKPMTRKEIIRMAQEAGFMEAGHPMNPWSAHTDQIEAFAVLVAKHTMLNIDPSKLMSHQEGFEAGQLSEREACAKWADLVAREIDNTNNTATYIASGIRARGEK